MSVSVPGAGCWMLTHFDDCTGIGGFSLAAQMAGGIETRWAREIDGYARAVYRKHFPGVELFGDAKEPLPARLVEAVGLYTAGFPCQPVSQAGKRKGTADDRWLWPWIAETIRFLRPDWLLLENTPGLVTLGLDGCLDDLEAAGYACWPLVLGADDVGAPHRRKRVWIVAHASRTRTGRMESKCQCGCSNKTEPCVGREGVSLPLRGRRDGQSGDEREGQTERGRACESGEDVADTEVGTKRAGFCESEQAGERWGRSGYFRRPECWCGRGEPWCCDPTERPTRPPFLRVAHGIPHRVHRLRCLGNAIVPQVAAEIMRAIVVLEKVR
jgi:DNA (cytosine-5)-methyltransferase 1